MKKLIFTLTLFNLMFTVTNCQNNVDSNGEPLDYLGVRVCHTTGFKTVCIHCGETIFKQGDEHMKGNYVHLTFPAIDGGYVSCQDHLAKWRITDSKNYRGKNTGAEANEVIIDVKIEYPILFGLGQKAVNLDGSDIDSIKFVTDGGTFKIIPRKIIFIMKPDDYNCLPLAERITKMQTDEKRFLAALMLLNDDSLKTANVSGGVTYTYMLIP
jgi:hypothetical protein